MSRTLSSHTCWAARSLYCTRLISVGAYLEDLPKDGEGMKIQGSVMVALAASKDEVLAELKKDVYSVNGVWDWNKVCCTICAQQLGTSALTSLLGPDLSCKFFIRVWCCC